jgi:hypothetical protein
MGSRHARYLKMIAATCLTFFYLYLVQARWFTGIAMFHYSCTMVISGSGNSIMLYYAALLYNALCESGFRIYRTA